MLHRYLHLLEIPQRHSIVAQVVTPFNLDASDLLLRLWAEQRPHSRNYPLLILYQAVESQGKVIRIQVETNGRACDLRFAVDDEVAVEV